MHQLWVRMLYPLLLSSAFYVQLLRCMCPQCKQGSRLSNLQQIYTEQRLSFTNPYRNHPNQQQQMGNRGYNNGFQAYLSPNQMGNNMDEFQMPPIKQGEHMPQEVFWKYISREGIRRSLAYMAERDYQPYLKAERKKNNIQQTPLKQSNNINWRAQVQFSESSMSDGFSEMSLYEEK